MLHGGKYLTWQTQKGQARTMQTRYFANGDHLCIEPSGSNDNEKYKGKPTIVKIYKYSDSIRQISCLHVRVEEDTKKGMEEILQSKDPNDDD